MIYINTHRQAYSSNFFEYECYCSNHFTNWKCLCPRVGLCFDHVTDWKDLWLIVGFFAHLSFINHDSETNKICRNFFFVLHIEAKLHFTNLKREHSKRYLYMVKTRIVKLIIIHLCAVFAPQTSRLRVTGPIICTIGA